MDVSTVPERLRIVTFDGRSNDGEGIAAELRAGLSGAARRIPAKYHYDAVGSALFDAITVLPEYYLTRTETAILREWGWEMVRAIGNPVDFLELGSGSAIKTRVLIEEALRVQRTLRYSPIDISPEALRASASALVSAYPSLEVHAYAADYFSLLRSQQLERSRPILALFLGSNVGNYEPHEAEELLRLLASALRPGDGVLIGTDLKKDRSVLELAYDDPAGVTAAFNLNALGRLNREYGANFDVRAFKHIARYDERRGSVDSFLRASHDVAVTIPGLDLELRIAAGEEVQTESSYKFDTEDIALLAKRTGYTASRSWTDADARFRVNLFLRE